MRPSLLLRTTSLLLLAASFYQLGSSPCGCWEHSGWHHALQNAPHDHLPVGGDEPARAVEADDCQHALPFVAILRDRAEPSHGPNLVGNPWAAEAPTALTAAARMASLPLRSAQPIAARNLCAAPRVLRC
ncbi:hypothetical protein [Botrimarina hoheduenensis]|uniref:Uncharacterized protein n=1 Tax=Botrimarina hoheduenensis TaxID=2528000 RepID=A0A5C5W9B8_9BACT|nr:hypothetical protein [Botrimarina hoheduenensis]TWT46873.1 hypothetical protein Pla111_19750 [Botrimarina hoheduenensis]